MPKTPDQAALIEVEIATAEHIHDGEIKSHGDKINVDEPTAKLLASKGIIKPLAASASPTPPEQQANSTTE